MTVTTSMSGLNELRAVLKDAQHDVAPETEKVMSRAGLNMKQGAARRVEGIRHAPAYPRAIGYDVFRAVDVIRTEVGPDKDRRQGALGNLFEYGSVNNAPIEHLGPALDDEAPRAERYLGELGVGLVS